MPRPGHTCLLAVNLPTGSLEDADNYFSHWGTVENLQHAYIDDAHRFLIQYATEEQAQRAYHDIRTDPIITDHQNKFLKKLFVLRSSDLFTHVKKKVPIAKTAAGQRPSLLPYTPPPFPDQDYINEIVFSYSEPKRRVNQFGQLYSRFYGQGGMNVFSERDRYPQY
ncbi:hypothetical protein P9112_011809 [Eukaryota sp. TZLM1-RC]